nr:hypothetical protein CFP56_02912 [Quercus suber]
MQSCQKRIACRVLKAFRQPVSVVGSVRRGSLPSQDSRRTLWSSVPNILHGHESLQPIGAVTVSARFAVDEMMPLAPPSPEKWVAA